MATRQEKEESFISAVDAQNSPELAQMLTELDQHLERINDFMANKMGTPVMLRSVTSDGCTDGKHKFCIDVGSKQICWCI